jgi:hypothetical protein
MFGGGFGGASSLAILRIGRFGGGGGGFGGVLSDSDLLSATAISFPSRFGSFRCDP